MAVTETPRGTLQALTAAALLLPGLAAHAAEPPSLNVHVARYEEGARDLLDTDSGLPALRADTLHLSGAAALRDRIRLSMAVTQDVWSGATPIAVAPLAANGNRPVLRDGPQGLITSGASPLINGRLALDAQRAVSGDARNVLVMSSASPELRREADLALEMPLAATHGSATLVLGGGISDEPDYRSRNFRVGGRYDFNEQTTTLTFASAFTRSDTAATLDPDAAPYLTRNAYAAQIDNRGNRQLLRGERRDRRFDLGITQIIDAASLLDAGVALTRGRGFMENPYKAVTVVFTGAAPGAVSGDVRAFLEQRPDARRQLAWHVHYARHFAAADGTLQLDYDHSRDDWGVDTHSVELGWAQSFGA